MALEVPFLLLVTTDNMAFESIPCERRKIKFSENTGFFSSYLSFKNGKKKKKGQRIDLRVT